MRKCYLTQPTDAAWTAGSPGSTDEMIAAGEKLGGKLALMDEGWWRPTITLPGEQQARVQDEHGQAIPGLYAVGNCNASAMGATYPASGATRLYSVTLLALQRQQKKRCKFALSL